MKKDLSKVQLEFIEILRQEISIISDEVSNFLHKEDVFQNRLKPLAGKIDGYVFQEGVRNHYSTVLIALRRQVGMDRSEVSLKRLLTKLSNNNTWITEEWYVKEWLKDSSLVKRDDDILAGFLNSIPNGEFKAKFGKEGYLDKSVVDGDIVRLENATTRIKQYVDQQLAHTDKNKQALNLKDDEYTLALKIIEEITSKYILLLNQVGMPRLTPVIQN